MPLIVMLSCAYSAPCAVFTEYMSLSYPSGFTHGSTMSTICMFSNRISIPALNLFLSVKKFVRSNLTVYSSMKWSVHTVGEPRS